MIRTILAAVAWLLVIGCPLLAYLGAAPSIAMFYGFALGGLLGIVSFCTGTIAWFLKKREIPTRIALSTILIVLLIAVLAGPALSAPMINDVTTDLDEPPEFRHAQTLGANEGRDMTYPSEFKSAVREGYPGLEPLTLETSPEEAYERALLGAQGHPNWTLTAEDDENLRFEGYATTSIFGWKDDFVVRVTEHTDGARVDMRSKSREGRGDLGANADRINEFFAELASN